MGHRISVLIGAAVMSLGLSGGMLGLAGVSSAAPGPGSETGPAATSDSSSPVHEASQPNALSGNGPTSRTHPRDRAGGDSVSGGTAEATAPGSRRVRPRATVGGSSLDAAQPSRVDGDQGTAHRDSGPVPVAADADGQQTPPVTVSPRVTRWANPNDTVTKTGESARAVGRPSRTTTTPGNDTAPETTAVDQIAPRSSDGSDAAVRHDDGDLTG
jgi:hypothetical protein